MRRARVAGGMVFGGGAAPLLAVATACAAARTAPAPNPPGELLSVERVEALAPVAQRAAWLRYLHDSERLRQLDRAMIDAELAALGRTGIERPPRGRAPLVPPGAPAEWLRGADARRLADHILSFQTPAGGWSKNVAYARGPRAPGQGFFSEAEWSYVGTFDNDATTSELRFLAAVHEAQPDERILAGFGDGLAYLFQAQFPNGCWPQVYPLQGGYHDAATYNDEAITNVLGLLRDVARGELPLAGPEERRRAAESLGRGVECVLASQVAVDGRRTVWAQQHDPLTLAPVAARAYEPAALTGGESADILEFLMSLDAPTPDVVEAVHAAAEWFRGAAIHGIEYRFGGRPVAVDGAGPLWARFYEIGTNRPIFADRDGQIRYSLDEVSAERLAGYAWYRDTPARTLREYERWARHLPR